MQPPDTDGDVGKDDGEGEESPEQADLSSATKRGSIDQAEGDGAKEPE